MKRAQGIRRLIIDYHIGIDPAEEQCQAVDTFWKMSEYGLEKVCKRFAYVISQSSTRKADDMASYFDNNGDIAYVYFCFL